MKKILIGGTFDLFHCGHLMMFKRAKEFGDYLVVFVSSDKETKQLKGGRRPIIPGKERAEIVKNISCVDEVLYSEDIITNESTLDIVKPNIYIQNLGSYDREIEEACDKRNIVIIKIPRQIPKSCLDTTKIINKIWDTKK